MDDSNDNIHVIIVEASDGTLTKIEAIIVKITNVNESLAGDYNFNGIVDTADYTVWRDTRGTTVPAFSGADGNGDGVVDGADYVTWKTYFGSALPLGLASAATSVTATSDAPEAEARTLSVAPTTWNVAERVPQTIEARATFADVVVQAATPQGEAPVWRDRVADIVLRDDALLAWLVERPERRQGELPAAEVERLPSESEDSDADQLVGTLDLAFASMDD
jgi:hypothetical protein